MKIVKLAITVLLLISGLKSISAQLKIGVMLPLMNSSENNANNDLGIQMLRGINDALEEYNGEKIMLKVEDTKKDAAITLQCINKLGSDSSVIAILGPVYSNELVSNAGAAKFHKIPIITPTATQNNIAASNEYVFQLNPTYNIRGRIMAKYAMHELGLKNFVILAESEYGKNFAESFADEVSSEGGKVVITKYYNSSQADMNQDLDEIKSGLADADKFIDFGNLSKTQAEKIKKIKFKFSYPDSLIGSRLVVSIYKILGPDAQRILDSAGIQYSKWDNAKSVIYGSADAIYVPILNSEEIQKIVPQYFSSGINLPLLGTSDWNNPKLLDENKMYLNKLYFDSDFYLGERKNGDLVNMDEQEIRNYYFGYDGMKLILDEVAKGNKTRESLNSALQKLTDYNSVHSHITIKDRTNHQSAIMLFSNGELKKIADYVY